MLPSLSEIKNLTTKCLLQNLTPVTSCAVHSSFLIGIKLNLVYWVFSPAQSKKGATASDE